MHFAASLYRSVLGPLALAGAIAIAGAAEAGDRDLSQ